MATALNLTLPLKQDAASLAALQELKKNFAAGPQKAIDAALRKSETVHYARFVVIDDKYIQVLTEFDGDALEYTEFFRKELPEVFKAVFSLAEGVPPWEEIDTPDAFFKASQGRNLHSLGESGVLTNGRDLGYVFAAYGDATVREINKALKSQQED